MQRSRVQRRGARIGIVIIVVVALVGFVFVTGQSPTDETSTQTTNETPATSEDGAAQEAPATNVEFVYGTAECPPIDGSAPQQREFTDSHQLCIDPLKSYTARFETNQGAFVVRLRPDLAPGTVNNFVSLARWKYYDGTKCHRVIENFVVQCGDPTATGTGGPGYSFADELPAAGDYVIGSIAMANSGPNTNGSQFFIITGNDGASLPPSYSLFGEVTEGLDTAVAAMAALFNPDPGANGVPPRSDVIINSVVITEA
jgi:cyclophilin family peptidyl-prolyl cis-trans isomerase